VAFISSLLSLLNLILQKLKLLWTLTELPGYNVRYTLCRWADAVKNILSTLKTLPKRVWQKDGDLPQDYTYHYSGMPGGLSEEDLDHIRGKKITEEQYDKIRKQL
jgi:hypothetical protein